MLAVRGSVEERGLTAGRNVTDLCATLGLPYRVYEGGEERRARVTITHRTNAAYAALGLPLPYLEAGQVG